MPLPGEFLKAAKADASKTVRGMPQVCKFSGNPQELRFSRRSMVTPLRASVASWLKGQRSSFQFPKCVGPECFCQIRIFVDKGKEHKDHMPCHEDE